MHDDAWDVYVLFTVRACLFSENEKSDAQWSFLIINSHVAIVKINANKTFVHICIQFTEVAAVPL